MEICYVIRVAMEDDMEDQVFPSIDGSGSILRFTINHPFSSCRDYITNSCISYSWETLAFGLYFPGSPEMVLQCPKDYCCEKEINHSFCTVTKPPVFDQYN